LNASFSEELRQENMEKWDKILNHNFIFEIGKDILPDCKFVFFLKQDRIFLEKYCNLLSMASKIASDRGIRAWLENLLDSTIGLEMPMQLEIIDKMEGGSLPSRRVLVEKVTQKYISYLERVANTKDLAAMLSAMAPCPWTYYEISSSLIRKSINSEASKQWIRFYSSNESLKQVTEIRRLLDKLAEDSNKEKKIRMKNYFSISCNYELRFWNMAYAHEKRGK
jgi:thiaminase (transcriptional activator TenA)